MPSLERIQRRFKDAILRGADDPAQARAGDIELSHAERFSVYAGGLVARVHDAMEETYEALFRVLGADVAHDIVHEYVRAYPPASYNLADAGKELEKFLHAHPLTEKLPFLPDLARFEWLVARSFHAPAAPPLNAQQLSSLPPQQWERAGLTFQPHVFLFSSPWAIFDIWASRKTDDSEFFVPQVAKATCILIHRREYNVVPKEISAPQFQLVTCLLNGEPLEKACEAIAESAQGSELSEWFTTWTTDGIFTGLTFLPAPL